jgi:hypothetical protein
MLTRSDILFCQQLISARVAQYGYDVYRFDAHADGTSYGVELTSPAQGKRTVLLTVFENTLAETVREGRLAEAITLNIDNEFRGVRRPDASF